MLTFGLQGNSSAELDVVFSLFFLKAVFPLLGLVQIPVTGCNVVFRLQYCTELAQVQAIMSTAWAAQNNDWYTILRLYH